MALPGLHTHEEPLAGVVIGSYGLILMAAGPIRFVPRGELAAGFYQLLLLELPAIAVAYGGYWVYRSDFDAEQRRRILDWCGWGTLLLGGLIVGAVFRELLTGSSVPDFDFFLLLGVASGAAGGLAFGVKDQYTKQYAGRVEAQADEVTAQREALFFLNRLLRHNVLNGMNVINGYAERLEYDAPATHTEDASVIRDQCDRIVTLIENVHTLGKTFAGNTQLTYIDLSAMLQNEVENARREYPTAEFSTAIPRGIHIRATELLSSVFDQLLRNAVEHNDQPTSHVDVKLRSNDETVVVEIADDGPGIPDDRKQAVFETDEWGDAGLGLYLAKSLVTNLAGEISIQDNTPSGTIVIVELPKNPTQSPDSAAAIRSAAAGWTVLSEGEPQFDFERPRRET